MAREVRARSEIPEEYTWDVRSIFPSDEVWEEAYRSLNDVLPSLDRFRGHLGEDPQTLLDYMRTAEDLNIRLGKLFSYASMSQNVDTSNQEAIARNGKARAFLARVGAATAFAEPEILAIGTDTLRRWMDETPDLAVYEHYFDQLESRREHVRSAEVEEVVGLARDPFATASSIHSTLNNTDLTFRPARTSSGDSIEMTQGNHNALLTDSDREVRRTAYESYADAHLALKNTMASCLAAGIKQDVFIARVRHYSSSLEAALAPNHIPTAVFHNLIDVFKRSLPTWHRYWRVRREALGYDQLHVYDIKAPLTDHAPEVPYEQAVQWIAEGLRPMGEEYVDVMRRGCTAERWVDIYPNLGKTSGAYSGGSYGTRPFILMSYTDDLFSMSTLAHELGHSMHSYYTRREQPVVYSRYGMFVAETASNFNQAMVRGYLMEHHRDPSFQIALIEEAMSNFHRYFFIMPTLARFELEIHERVERGESLTADGLIDLMAGLFKEGYGDEVVTDREQIGITWAQFATHLYANFYVFQYATGISGANALARAILDGEQGAAERYIDFLKAGGSVYALDALKLAGVDMTSPEPIERAFGVMGDMVERLAELTKERASATT